jgi:hypothetical protein
VETLRIVAMTSFRLIVGLCLLATVAFCQAPAELTVQGISGPPITLTAADVAGLPQHRVQVKDNDTQVAFEGVLLTDVLAKVDRPAGETFHKTVASYYLQVEARDGYRAVFAWAELDPSFLDKAVYVVTRRDGKALTEKDGPFQLVAPGEKRGARWVRQVAALRIRKAN